MAARSPGVRATRAAPSASRKRSPRRAPTRGTTSAPRDSASGTAPREGTEPGRASKPGRHGSGASYASDGRDRRRHGRAAAATVSAVAPSRVSFGPPSHAAAVEDDGTRVPRAGRTRGGASRRARPHVAPRSRDGGRCRPVPPDAPCSPRLGIGAASRDRSGSVRHRPGRPLGRGARREFQRIASASSVGAPVQTRSGS